MEAVGGNKPQKLIIVSSRRVVKPLAFLCAGCVSRPATGAGRADRYYETDGSFVDPLLPRITPLPAEFWAGA
jgi:hypothetical protein